MLPLEINMTHNALAPVDAEQSKLVAHAIKRRFDELNTPMKLNHAYEALAIAHRYPNWATMKASLKPLEPSRKARFCLGRYRNGVDIEVDTRKMLSHVHVYSTSQVARRELLLALSWNAIENSAALIFVEPVFEEKIRNAAITQILDMASKCKRAGDVYVVDLSNRKSRLGNSFNVLADVKEAAEVARMFMVGSSTSRSVYFDYLKVIEVAAKRAIDAVSKIGGFPKAVVTAEMILTELERMASGEALWVEGQDWRTNGDSLSSVASASAAFVRVVIQKYSRFFDSKSEWSGPRSSVAMGNILLIFVSDSPDDFESYLQQFVTKSVKNAVLDAPKSDGRYPDMVVSNDVDGFSCTSLAQDAREHRVCLAIGDQCQTLPSALKKGALRFRSDQGVANYADHYMLDEDGNTSVHLDMS
jgi:hypothetical protein